MFRGQGVKAPEKANNYERRPALAISLVMMQSSRGTLISSTKKSTGRAETFAMEELGNYENTMHAMLQIRVFAEN